MFEKVTGHCQIRGCEVALFLVNLGKGKGGGTKTPVRCESSATCDKSSFCKFVNPLSNRIPVQFGGGAENPAEAS